MAFLSRGTFTLAAAAFVCACSPATSRPSAVPGAAARPALWKLADEDTTIYLFGTIHLLPANTHWRTPSFDKALAQADTLVVEVKLPDDPAATAKVMVKLGMSPNLPPLAERVPPEKREALKTMIGASGAPAAVLDKMETWAAALTLASGALVQLGYDPALGVERQLTQDPGQAHRTTIGLETAEEQLGFFDSLSEDAQRSFLVGTLDDPAKARAEFEAMLGAWLAGDVDRIARTFDAETSLSPELRDILMHRRNEKWTQWLAKRMDQPGTILVAVGAGHLAGPDSVRAMLKAKGFKVKRVQ